jgi:predicted AlkP superfamily phosphohydrolase/phosphomutase
VKIDRARIFAIVASVMLVAWPDFSPVHGQAAVRAIILSWDGAVPSLVHDLLRQGKLPNLAGLIAGGAFADSAMTVYPSETAPGYASLWTGAPPRITGISGNSVPATPRDRFTILESVSGFYSTSLRAEPLWMSAARAGRRAVIVQATQAWPFESYVADGPFGPGQPTRLALFEGYAGIAGRDGVVTARGAPPRAANGWSNLPPSAVHPREIAFTIGASRFFGLFIDDPRDPARGYDTLIVAEDKDGARIKATLKPGISKPAGIERWSGTIDVQIAGGRRAGTYLRLFDLKADGSDFLLYFTRPVRDLGSHPELLAALRKAAGGFIGNGASDLYSQGAFGPTIPDGGDGSAEQRYLETVLLTQRQLISGARWALQNPPWDLFFAYTPYPDEAEHLWRGYLEAGLSGFRPDIAGRLRPFLEEVYRTCDEFLGSMMSLRPPHTIIALVSDHGVEGVNKAVAINAALERAGLLARGKRGRADLAKTKALYPVINNGYILLNTTDRKGGIVRPEERAAVVGRIRQALSQIRDGGRQVVTGIFDAETEGSAMGIGGQAGGDIYLDLLPGYDFDARIHSVDLVTERKPYGMHGFHPARLSMRTIMVLNGPGVAAGKRLEEARAIDFAPTLAKLLGIPAPRHASGQILWQALSRQP